MRLTRWSSRSTEKSGSKGKYSRGYGKGSAAANPDKWKPRTPAQERRHEKLPRNWR